MIWGNKPEAAVAEAKEFAKRRGYFPIDNLHEDLPFDILIFKRESVRVVSMNECGGGWSFMISLLKR